MPPGPVNSESGEQVITMEKFKVFSEGSLPKFINIFGVFRKVLNFVPSVLRCFRCQKFGHGTNFCRNIDICSNCAQHHSCDCKSPPFCTNCKKPHPASSRECIFYLFHKEVNFIKACLNITKQEAMFLAGQRYQSRLQLDSTSNIYEIEIPNPYIDDFTLNSLTIPLRVPLTNNSLPNNDQHQSIYYPPFQQVETETLEVCVNNHTADSISNQSNLKNSFFPTSDSLASHTTSKSFSDITSQVHNEPLDNRQRPFYPLPRTPPPPPSASMIEPQDLYIGGKISFQDRSRSHSPASVDVQENLPSTQASIAKPIKRKNRSQSNNVILSQAAQAFSNRTGFGTPIYSLGSAYLGT